MNDHCAAVTGRFLENMALALGLSIEQLGQHAQGADRKAARLSSMYTVFAESEVVSLIGRGEDSHRVTLGFHQVIVKRLGAMIRSVGTQERFIFAGSVAYNPCIQQLLAQELSISLTVPSNPQTVGALGAALWAAKLAPCVKRPPTDVSHTNNLLSND